MDRTAEMSSAPRVPRYVADRDAGTAGSVGPAFSTLAARWLIGLTLSLVAGVVVAEEAETPAFNPEELRFFETNIRPLLAEHCYKCHGEEKQKGELRLDSLAAILEGGSYGPAVVPHQPDESPLIEAILYEGLEMPPDAQLPDDKIALLTRWVEMGAPWPNAGKVRAPVGEDEPHVTEEDRQFWSYRPRVRPAVPHLQDDDWVTSDVDAFIRRKQLEQGLEPAPPATKRALIRRAYFDLIGLPPTLAEVRAFEQDDSPGAFEKVVDRLLAMPQYGERWGRHWLDLVRYAQTNGYERDDEKPFAWRFRDYVIRAFNEDKPYDQFVREQLAGDELDEVTDDSIIATGFYRLGVWDDEPDTILQAYYDGLDDMLSTTGTAFLGMTIGCARCHEHKFDPISNDEYYQLTAFIRNVNYYRKPNEDSKNEVIFTQLSDGHSRALSVHEYGREPRKTNVTIRGQAASMGKEVEPRFPLVLSASEEATKPSFPERPETARTSGRRRVLAEWIANETNPLTARVMANRLWHYHFGQGIVQTTSDFGKIGSPPSHPELLDWLASELVDGGWRLKRMHKLIMLTSTYQQSSRVHSAKAVEVDPGNTLLWRQNLRRLEAEAIRDSMLAVNGTLNSRMGGPSFYPNLTADVLAGQSMPGRGWGRSSRQERSRRSVYAFIKRSVRIPMLDTFDFPTTDKPVARRVSTTVAPQALALLNSEFLQEQAESLADRLTREVGDDPAEQIRLAYRLALAREARPAEVAAILDYVSRQRAAFHRVKVAPTIEPRLPSALHKSYLAGARSTEFLAGPRVGWSYYIGDWPGRGDSIHWIQYERGPFALWDPVKFADATVTTRVYPHRNSHFVALVARANADGELFQGYELYLDLQKNRAALRRHGREVTTLAEVPVNLVDSRWYDLKLELTGSQLRAWLDGSSKPLLEAKDDQPFTAPGHVGLRTWGAALTFDTLRVDANGSQVDAATYQGDMGDVLARLPDWHYYGGDWTAYEDGSYGAKTDGYQYAVWLQPTFANGEVEARLMSSDEYDAEVLFRVTSPRRGTDTFRGYEVAINARAGYVRLAKHEDDFQPIVDVPYDIKANEWHHVRVRLDGGHIRVYVDGGEQPLIDHYDAKPLPRGRVALRTGGEARFTDLVARGEGQQWRADFRPPAGDERAGLTPERRALVAMCNMILNLNEFLYID
ncbi:MAG: DUF1553 domain-containing protein [Planctomycetota bacterium]|nr:MAG: DUF1553 domain-containing protein [Planctomycetota bacterium]